MGELTEYHRGAMAESEMRDNSEEKLLTVKREIVKVDLKKDSIELLKDDVVAEDQIELYVNNEHYAIFSSSPSQIKELAIGHLLSEGVINKLEEIASTEISKGKVHINLTKKVRSKSSGRPKIILTACSDGAKKIPPHLWMKSRFKDATDFRLTPQTILGAVETLNSLAGTFKRTGGTHASAILNESGEVLAFAEDIGRHNAVDKIIGETALKGVDFGRTLLVSTGRLTSEMVIKAARVGIPLVVSISAPTDKGIKIAETAGLTLIGFARGGRFNIYTYPERIKNFKTVSS